MGVPDERRLELEVTESLSECRRRITGNEGVSDITSSTFSWGDGARPGCQEVSHSAVNSPVHRDILIHGPRGLSPVSHYGS